MEKDPILFRKFDGGWNSEDASDELQLHESPDSVNAEFTKGGSVTKATGTTELGSDSEDATITGLVKAPNRNGVNWLFKFCSTKFKIYDSVNSIWSTVKTGLTSGEKWGDVTFNNVLYLGSQVDNAMSMDLGQITRLDGAISAGAATIDLVDASQFDASGDVFINDVLVSYTGKTGNQLTGCSNAVDTPDTYIVSQALTAHAGTPKGNMLIIFGGRLIVAGVTGSGGSTIYGSKATDRTDFTIAGGGAANDAFAEALVSKINAIKVFYDDDLNERIMAFMASNAIYAINVTDETATGTLVFSKFFKGNVTALNHFSTVVGENDIFHVDLNNQIRTLGPRTDDGSGRNFSDSISRKHKTLFRDEYDFDNSRGAIVSGELWTICSEESDSYNDRIVIFDINKGAWRKRTGIPAVDVLEFQNRVTIASAVENKVFQVQPGVRSDDDHDMYFKHSTLDIDVNPLNFERLRAVRISGIMSETCENTVKVYRDFGNILLGEFSLDGDNDDIIGAVLAKEGSYGSVVFGGVPFGGEESEDRKFFIAHLDLTTLPDSENFRVVVENNQAGVILEISKIKPLIFTQKPDYFPKQYIINTN
jgi:hypothetical protein